MLAGPPVATESPHAGSGESGNISFRVDLANRGIPVVSNIDVPGGIHRRARGESSVALWRLRRRPRIPGSVARKGADQTGRGNLADPAVVGVGEKYVAALIDREPVNIGEFRLNARPPSP